MLSLIDFLSKSLFSKKIEKWSLRFTILIQGLSPGTKPRLVFSTPTFRLCGHWGYIRVNIRTPCSYLLLK